MVLSSDGEEEEPPLLPHDATRDDSNSSRTCASGLVRFRSPPAAPLSPLALLSTPPRKNCDQCLHASGSPPLTARWIDEAISKTLSAFALGLTLFVLTLGLNLIALRTVRRFREQYD